MIYVDDRVMLFIDGSNFFSSIKYLGYKPDFRKIVEYYESKLGAKLVARYYYTALKPKEDINPVQPLVDYLTYNGWRVVTKPITVHKQSDGPDKIKGNMDIELAMDMLTHAVQDDYDVAVLFTGDGDFASLVRRVQQRGKRVIAVSYLDDKSSTTADVLRRQVDKFDNLKLMKDIFRAEDHG